MAQKNKKRKKEKQIENTENNKRVQGKDHIKLRNKKSYKISELEEKIGRQPGFSTMRKKQIERRKEKDQRRQKVIAK